MQNKSYHLNETHPGRGFSTCHRASSPVRSTILLRTPPVANMGINEFNTMLRDHAGTKSVIGNLSYAKLKDGGMLYHCHAERGSNTVYHLAGDSYEARVYSHKDRSSRPVPESHLPERHRASEPEADPGEIPQQLLSCTEEITNEKTEAVHDEITLSANSCRFSFCKLQQTEKRFYITHAYTTAQDTAYIFLGIRY